MPRAKTTMTTKPGNGRALDGHGDMPIRQNTISALGTKPPQTNGAPSVFALAKAARKGRRPGSLDLDPNAVEIRTGVPIPGRSIRPPVYSTLWARMPVGGMVELPPLQAKALAAYARTRPGAKASRRTLGDGKMGVWRLA